MDIWYIFCDKISGEIIQVNRCNIMADFTTHIPPVNCDKVLLEDSEEIEKVQDNCIDVLNYEPNPLKGQIRVSKHMYKFDKVEKKMKLKGEYKIVEGQKIPEKR